MLNQYDCLIRPIVTEKSMLVTSNGFYTFEVDSCATKKDVGLAVESVFNVRVDGVKILNRKGKLRIFKSRRGVRSDSKRAFVHLKEGTINFEGGF
ncbi:MAG: 50S ribosomal protein L23 [Holosporales bacterium]|jgi:large subunit ribosomal protein L23|nr:50S ribosomal protein L23 [Holosporales bacterium]